MTFERRDLLIGRLTYVRSDLQEVVSKLTDADLDWAPQPGMRSVGGQLAEIISTEGQFNEVFTGKPFDFGGRYEEIKALDSLEEILAALSSTRELTLSRIEAASDEYLSEEVPIDPTWFEAGGLSILPRIEILHALPMHEWYHTGAVGELHVV